MPEFVKADRLESDITRGLLVWNLSDSAVAGARKLGHLNPQTQEFTIDLK
ncbi:MAG: hypothetical protein ACRDJJ_10510 [Actinomycetota bacterium]